MLQLSNFGFSLLVLRPGEKWHEGEIAKSRDIVAIAVCQGRLWNTFIFSHRDLFLSLNSQDQIYKTKMVQYNQMTSENQNEGEIAKSRQLRHVEGDSEIWNISSSNSQNQIFKTKMVQQWWCTCHTTHINTTPPRDAQHPIATKDNLQQWEEHPSASETSDNGENRVKREEKRGCEWQGDGGGWGQRKRSQRG